jgi:hypothetical protein
MLREQDSRVARHLKMIHKAEWRERPNSTMVVRNSLTTLRASRVPLEERAIPIRMLLSGWPGEITLLRYALPHLSSHSDNSAIEFSKASGVIRLR